MTSKTPPTTAGEASKPCSCLKFEPHLWRPICKTCFHPKNFHVEGRCTHKASDTSPQEPKSIFATRKTDAPQAPVAVVPKQPLKTPLKQPSSSPSLTTPSRSKDIEPLRDIVTTLTSLVGSLDQQDDISGPGAGGAQPRPLCDVFADIVGSAVSAAGIADEPFAKDFLAAFKISLSTNPHLSTTGQPLEVSQISHIRSLGKSVWSLWKQQDFLRTVTQSQALIAVRTSARRAAPFSAWSKPPILTWFERLKSLAASERAFCMHLEGDPSELAAVASLYRHHRSLCSRLEEVCSQYPGPGSCTGGACFFPWIDEAVPLYAMVHRELAFATREGNESRATYLAPVCARLAAYESALGQVAEAYAAVVAKASVLSQTDRVAVETDAALMKRAASDAAAAAAEATKRAAESAMPAAVHFLRVPDEADELSPKSRAHHRRRVSTRRKTVSDVISMLSSPLQLPEHTSRIVQVSGSVVATVRPEGAAASPSQEYRHHLMTDVWIVHTYTKPFHCAACINLREANVFAGSSSFEVVSPGFTVTVTHGKPKNLDTMIRENIARLRVFGVPLEDMLNSEKDEGNEMGVPRVALQLMEFIEKNGFEKEGLFRVAGKPSVIAALHTALDNRSTEIDFSAVTVHDVAHLFKRFLAELPEPLLTQEGYKKFMSQPLPKDDPDIRRFVDSAKAIIRGLPPAHSTFARVVFAFLSVCADCHAKTKMGVGSLAIVLAPVILRAGGVDVMAPDVACVTKANDIVRLMIENHFDVFC